MDEFSGLGITSALCPTFFFQPYAYLHCVFVLSFPSDIYNFGYIYSVNDSQETRETRNISRVRDKYSEWLKQFI